nr:shikimate kinase [uncultured Holophaga sp.]
MKNLPPILPVTDPTLSLPLAGQVRLLGEQGFPLVLFRSAPLDGEDAWAQLHQALSEAALRGGWPLITVEGRAELVGRAAAEGLTPWGVLLSPDGPTPTEIRSLPGLEGLHIAVSTQNPLQWFELDAACDHVVCGPFHKLEGQSEPLETEGLLAACSILQPRGLGVAVIGGLTPEDTDNCFWVGSSTLAWTSEFWQVEEARTLLWEAQLLRWKHQPPVAPGQGVLLVGGSGGGKSTLGRALAPMLGLPLKDLDDCIEERAGVSIPDIFAYAGEQGFRDLETRHLQDALSNPCVLCVGAGAWQREENRRVAQDSGFSVLWLAEDPEVAWSRVGRDPHRPLAQEEAGFRARWRSRIGAWSLLSPVLPLGRQAEELARALAASARSGVV